MGGDLELRYTDSVQTETVKYYSGAGGERIAMRSASVGSTWSPPTYLLHDHLGSITATTDASGNLLNQQRYKPFGEVRTDLPSPAYRITITDFGYTGQKALMSLMDYHSRWYDQGLARFISADTVVPNPADSQSWDRYSYVFNNPLNYIDPTGHFGKHREDRSDYWNKRNQEKVKEIERQWGKERDEARLKELVRQATKEMLLDASLGFSYARGGKALLGKCLGSLGPNFGQWFAGGLVIIAGVATMAMGGIVIGSALGEIAAAQAVAAPTFGLSEVLAVVHAPAQLAIGGLIFAAGAGMTYFGGKTMWQSGVLQSSFLGILNRIPIAE
jgi:RHS repeat-associated protein